MLFAGWSHCGVGVGKSLILMTLADTTARRLVQSPPADCINCLTSGLTPSVRCRRFAAPFGIAVRNEPRLGPSGAKASIICHATGRDAERRIRHSHAERS